MKCILQSSDCSLKSLKMHFRRNYEQITIWANYTFSLWSKRLLYSCTDESFHHFILWYFSLIPPPLFNIHSFGRFLTNLQAILFFPAPLYPRQCRLDTPLLCSVYIRERQGHLTSKKAITSWRTLDGSPQRLFWGLIIGLPK